MQIGHVVGLKTVAALLDEHDGPFDGWNELPNEVGIILLHGEVVKHVAVVWKVWGVHVDRVCSPLGGEFLRREVGIGEGWWVDAAWHFRSPVVLRVVSTTSHLGPHDSKHGMNCVNVALVKECH